MKQSDDIAINKVYHGDCLEVMPRLPRECIDLTVTSPPYDNLRNYSNTLEWGEHIWKPVLKELYQITKPGGVVVWVVNDATINGSETGTSFKQALYAIECGFNLHDTMIWQKSTFANPSSPSAKRYHQVFEYMFVFSKGKPKTFNPIMDRPNKYAGKTSWGQTTYRDKNGNMRKRKSYVYDEFGKRYNVWVKNTASQSQEFSDHPAVLATSVITDHILSWSNESDLVFDPFAGSGNTGAIAADLNRNFLMIEKNEEYYNMCMKKMENRRWKMKLS